MRIIVDDLKGPEIAALLQVHLDAMHEHSPPESVYALDLDKLRQARHHPLDGVGWRRAHGLWRP
jgi:hypothetical protein